MTKLKQLPLYLKIFIGVLFGALWGVTSTLLHVPEELTIHYIKPIGEIFTALLKMIAVPLVLASLIMGVANLNDVKKLSKLGGKTIFIYITTTLISITIGLLAVNIIQPGKSISEETRNELLGGDFSKVKTIKDNAKNTADRAPLDPLVEIVPENIFASAAKNSMMLQVVFVAVLFGIAAISIPEEQRKPFIHFFESLNHITLKVIDFIMALAPYAVFALISAIIIETKDPQLIKALGWYSLTVLIGLAIMTVIVYPLMVQLFTNVSVVTFFKGIRPAQLLAFSSSSSSATLPITMRQCEEEIGVREEVSSFCLPLGATINMDGTSLYQGVAAVFIAQVMQIDLSLTQQLTIVFTALLASIGSAGVPGAGMVMLAIVLQSIQIPVEYIALILAPDRILDMCRTTTNVTGDAAVATVVNGKQ